MARIDDVSTNGMNFKHLDTTKDIVITPKNEFGGSVQLDASHTWTAKVSDGANYVGDYPVKIGSNGIVVNSSDFTTLPAGDYHLEVWEEWIDSNGSKQRSIYPSPQRTIDFNIYQNISDLAEKEIKTIGFQDVVDQAVMNIGMNYAFKVNMIEPDQTATVVQAAADGKNYATFNIPRGAKGDQGTVGPAPTLKIGTVTKLDPDQTPTANLSGDNGSYTLDMGIPQGQKGDKGDTDETATNALNVANSVNDKLSVIQANGGGVNLAVGTGLKYEMVIGSLTTTWKDGYAYLQLPLKLATFEIVPIWPYTSFHTINKGTTYTQTIWFETDAKLISSSGINFTWFTNGAGHDAQPATLVNLGENKYKVYSTYMWPGKSDNNVRLFDIYNGLGYAFDLSTGTYLKFGKLMFEEGTVAHDWSPAPKEILTQSDYAKIKAAIVALGGSLS